MKNTNIKTIANDCHSCVKHVILKRRTLRKNSVESTNARGLTTFQYLGKMLRKVPLNRTVDICSRESNSRPYDCEADTLPHDHGHHSSKVT